LPKCDNRAMLAARILDAEDVRVCCEQYLADPSRQVARRNLIRAQFAFVEAGLYGLRYMAALSDASNIPKKTPAKQNVENSFNEVARTLGLPIALAKQNAGWDAMTKAINIRDRISHPKTPDDLTITDSDMKVFDRATKWFSDVMIELKSVVE